MAKTFAQLKTAVAGFMQRSTSTFVRDVGLGTEFDLLKNAINNARLYTERMIDFEYSKAEIQLDSVSLTTGGSLANAKLKGTATAASVKKLLVPYLESNDGSIYPVDLISKRSYTERVKRKFEGRVPTDKSTDLYLADNNIAIVQVGRTVFVAPANESAFASTTFTLYADAVLWLADYVGSGTETDFLLDFAFDWLMYRSIFELNFYLKEDERVVLSDQLVKSSWDAVVKWNNELVMANVDDVANLD